MIVRLKSAVIAASSILGGMSEHLSCIVVFFFVSFICRLSLSESERISVYSYLFTYCPVIRWKKTSIVHFGSKATAISPICTFTKERISLGTTKAVQILSLRLFFIFFLNEQSEARSVDRFTMGLCYKCSDGKDQWIDETNMLPEIYLCSTVKNFSRCCCEEDLITCSTMYIVYCLLSILTHDTLLFIDTIQHPVPNPWKSANLYFKWFE